MLKCCCDYMANFSLSAVLEIGRKNLQESVLYSQLKRCASPSSYFSICNYMRFFSPFDQAEISSPFSETGWKFQPRLKLSSCNHQRLFKKNFSGGNLSPANWAEIQQVILPNNVHALLDKGMSMLIPKKKINHSTATPMPTPHPFMLSSVCCSYFSCTM